MLAMEVIIDLMFIADVVLHFRTTTSNPDTKETITDTRKIAVR